MLTILDVKTPKKLSMIQLYHPLNTSARHLNVNSDCYGIYVSDTMK